MTTSKTISPSSSSSTDQHHDQADVKELRGAIDQLMQRARSDLKDLVAIESMSDRKQFSADGCDQAAQQVADLFRAEGFADITLHVTPDASKVVIGHIAAPKGAPTVLLYCHYDVQPPIRSDDWRTPPFELTEKDGGWFGRGAADCKGNIVTHLTALRAMGGAPYPVGLIVVAEGSEEQGNGGLEGFLEANAELFRADAMLICDAGNFAVGVPAVTTSLRGVSAVTIEIEALRSTVHSGMFGGAAPDPLVALIQVLSTLHDEHGNVSITGLDATQKWKGEPYSEAQFRTDAGLLDGVEIVGSGTVADMLWARPSVTVTGMACQPMAGAVNAIPPSAGALVSLRIPPGIDPLEAQDKLIAQLTNAAPWGVKVRTIRDIPGAPFSTPVDGPAYRVLARAMGDAYSRPMVSIGQGGSIPLCELLQRTFPETEIAIIGVEEPLCSIHSPNESVAPSEIATMALVEALFLQRYNSATSAQPVEES
jgi:acetylornithine deacetylase/succinyl-diaminopimelate desuccinylase-like protein